jgi:DNA-binding response OmpR family regulator
MDRILLIDDDKEFSGLLTEYMSLEGYQCTSVYNGEIGLMQILKGDFVWDLVILDLMLPGKNGLDILSEVRSSGFKVPVIILTAKGDSMDKVVGLEMGADDYLAKPFNPRELIARIRTVLRRVREVKPSILVPTSRGGFVLDKQTYSARYLGEDLDLTGVEFKILLLLVENMSEIVSRERLFLEALGRHATYSDRSLDMHISRIRKKIWPQADGSKYLKSIRGEGYILITQNT